MTVLDFINENPDVLFQMARVRETGSMSFDPEIASKYLAIGVLELDEHGLFLSEETEQAVDQYLATIQKEQIKAEVRIS